MNLLLAPPVTKTSASASFRHCRRSGLVLALLAFFVGTPAPAHASRIQPAVVVGVVKSINRPARTLTLQPVVKGAAFSVHWDGRTNFLVQGSKTDADALKEGTKVELKYHSPLFGSRYATDVKWQ